MMVTIESTAAKTGRSMKKWANLMSRFLGARRRAAGGGWRGPGQVAGRRRRAKPATSVARVGKVGLVHLDGRWSASLGPRAERASVRSRRSDHPGEYPKRSTANRRRARQIHWADRYFIVLVHDQHVLLALVVADGGVGHQHRVIAPAARHASSEQTGRGSAFPIRFSKRPASAWCRWLDRRGYRRKSITPSCGKPVSLPSWT